MQRFVQYTRIYALNQTQPTTPTNHPASPIQLADFPQSGTRAEIHVGAVPDDILQALRLHRAYIKHAFRRGGCDSADELRRLAADIPEQTVLADEESIIREPANPHWYVTLFIEDQVELPDDTAQKLLGVAMRPWTDLDSPEFLGRHTEALDKLAVRMALAVAPYRYKWRAWDGPLVFLPTNIALRPPMIGAGRPRVFVAPPLERTDISELRSTAQTTALHSVPMVVHFYLRATTGTDRIARFFDAFRALERLCRDLEDSLRPEASANCAKASAATQDKAAKAFRQSRRTLRKIFATMALAFNPTGSDADMDNFKKLCAWRNDLAHGNRKLKRDEAPDEETFELLHRYLAEVTARQ